MAEEPKIAVVDDSPKLTAAALTRKLSLAGLLGMVEAIAGPGCIERALRSLPNTHPTGTSHCTCGKVISANKTHCRACAEREGKL